MNLADKGNSGNDYRSILSRISAFGGVQIFSILINLIRGKFVALFLGPAGMGVSSLFTSSANTLQQFSSLGLNLAMVKEVAAAAEGENLPKVISVSMRLVLLTAGFGALLCFSLSPLLSLWTFGDSSQTFWYMLLSVSVAFSVAGSGYLSLLQGVGAVKRLSLASVIGGLCGLLFGVPLYYFFGTKGIVPAMIVLSLSVFMFYYISFRRCALPSHVDFHWQEMLPFIRRIVVMGLVLLVGNLAGTLVGYLINAFVRYAGSLEDVGMFQAANSITGQYMGVVFSALALDYFPRLSAAVHDRELMGIVINRQCEIVSLLVCPIVLLLIVSAPIVIRILLTSEFLPVTQLMRWMGLGVVFQTLNFPLGYLFIAHENKRVYLWTEVVMSNVVWIACSIGFYYMFSLIGLGVSMVVRAIIEYPVIVAVARKYYGFKYTRRTVVTIILSTVLSVAGFLASMIPHTYLSYILMLSLFLVSAVIAFVRLRNNLHKTS